MAFDQRRGYLGRSASALIGMLFFLCASCKTEYESVSRCIRQDALQEAGNADPVDEMTVHACRSVQTVLVPSQTESELSFYWKVNCGADLGSRHSISPDQPNLLRVQVEAVWHQPGSVARCMCVVLVTVKAESPEEDLSRIDKIQITGDDQPFEGSLATQCPSLGG